MLYIIYDGGATTPLSATRPNSRTGVASSEYSVDTAPLELVRTPGTELSRTLGYKGNTRSILPYVNHFGLVRHDSRIFSDGIYSREDKLDLWSARGPKNIERGSPFHHIRA